MTVRVRHVEEVMGTVFTVDAVFSDRDDAAALETVVAASQELHQVDATFSTWRDDSLISQLRSGALTINDMPASVVGVLGACARARDLSDGWFDPWAAPGGVDPTGYVKGWSGQQVLKTLRRAGADAALVNAAGDVGGFGRPESDRRWRIGLTDPLSVGEMLGVVTVDDCALAVSGTYERGAHIYNPAGGPASANVISAAVMGPELGLADALATGLVAGGEAALDPIRQLPNFEALVIFADGLQIMTEFFPLSVDSVQTRST